MALTRHVTLPFARHHRVQCSLLLFSISLGVATMVATSTLVDSAVKSIELAWTATAPEADLRVANGFAGVAEALLEEVRAVEGVESAEAILVDQAAVEGEPVVLVGIDLLGADAIHLTPKTLDRETLEVCEESDFLLKPNAIALPRRFAETLGVSLCSLFPAAVRSGRVDFYVAGLFQAGEDLRAIGESVVVMDLPRAQILLGREGVVDAIDVTTAATHTPESVAHSIERVAGAYATVARHGAESPELRSMIFNIRLILGVAGSVAVVVGALIIFNVMSIAASKRKPVFDMVTALGATRRSIQIMIAFEALVLGSIGAALGVGAGLGIALLASSLFRGAIGALYLPFESSVFSIPTHSLVVAFGCGVALTLLASMGPALSVMRLASGLAVTSPARERAARLVRLTRFGFIALVVGFGLRFAQVRSLDAEVLGTLVTVGACLVFLGAGLIVPGILYRARLPVSKLLDAASAPHLSLAWRTMCSDPARSAVVIVSVMAGVAYFLMSMGAVGSLRHGVITWIKTTQQADIMVAAQGGVGFLPSSRPIAEGLGPAFLEVDGVASIESSRLVAQPYLDRWTVVVAKDPAGLTNPDRYMLRSGDLASSAEGLRRGTHAIVSETLSVKHDLHPGDLIELRTPTGLREFEVAAVAIDYNSDLGSIVISRDAFVRWWRDHGVTAYQIWLAPGADRVAVVDRINHGILLEVGAVATPIEDLYVVAEGVVDSAFYAGYALVFVAVLVMIASVVSFFLVSTDERAREIATMREVGAEPSQLLKLFLSEALIIGVVGGGLGCVVGVVMAQRLVADSVRVGGGMELAFHMPAFPIVVGFLSAVVVSVLSAVVPIVRHVNDPNDEGLTGA